MKIGCKNTPQLAKRVVRQIKQTIIEPWFLTREEIDEAFKSTALKYLSPAQKGALEGKFCLELEKIRIPAFIRLLHRKWKMGLYPWEDIPPGVGL